MVGKTYLGAMLDDSGFDAATKMGGFALSKVPEVSLVPESFWTSIFSSTSLVGAADKRSV